MDNAKLIERLEKLRDRALRDAELLQDTIDKLGGGIVAQDGGGNGNGPPPQP